MPSSKIVVVCLVIYSALFGRVLLYAMDLAFAPIPFLPKDIVWNHIVPHLVLQDIAYLKRTCRAYVSGIDLEKISCDCMFHRCRHFEYVNYGAQNKLLVHYASTENSIMYQHLWNKEAALHCLDFQNAFYDKYKTMCVCRLTEKEKMKKYLELYGSSDLVGIIRLRQLLRALFGRVPIAAYLVTKIFPETDFDIFSTARDYRKKKIKKYKKNCSYRLRDIFKEACKIHKLDLLLAMLGGWIGPRAFKYVFRYASKQAVEKLVAKQVFVMNMSDEKGKYWIDYYSAMI